MKKLYFICIFTTLLNSCYLFDTEAPKLSITSHKSGEMVENSFTLSGTASDNISLQKIVVECDSESITASGKENWECDVTTIDSGLLEMSVHAYDMNNNVSTAKLVLQISTLESNSPIITINQHIDNDDVASTFMLSGTVSDESAVKEVIIELDGTQEFTATGKEEWAYTFSGLSAGKHFFIIKAWDIADNLAIKTLTLNVN